MCGILGGACGQHVTIYADQYRLIFLLLIKILLPMINFLHHPIATKFSITGLSNLLTVHIFFDAEPGFIIASSLYIFMSLYFYDTILFVIVIMCYVRCDLLLCYDCCRDVCYRDGCYKDGCYRGGCYRYVICVLLILGPPYITLRRLRGLESTY